VSQKVIWVDRQQSRHEAFKIRIPECDISFPSSSPAPLAGTGYLYLGKVTNSDGGLEVKYRYLLIEASAPSRTAGG